MRRILALCLLLAALASAETPQSMLERANLEYSQGHYAPAAEGYRQLLAQGWRTGPVYYNLGNAYQKLGDLGRARAAYENALALTPRDASLRKNRAQLLSQLADKPAPPTNLEWLASFFTGTELTVAASFFYWLGAVLMLGQMKRRAVWRTAVLGGCALGVLFFGGLWAVREYGQSGDPAVVIPAEVSLYDGPGRDFEAGLKLHAGSQVEILQSRGDWREVAALGRVQGWLRAEEIEPIRP